MKVRTWLEKLTDESSLWFNAIKAEDDGDLVSAVSYYLKDAQKSAEAKSIIRHALSCSCAARCLSRIGNSERANKLYVHAANLYLLNAQQTMAASVREAMWSMNEALENYVLADDYDSASSIRKSLRALEARVNPFASGAKAEDDLQTLRDYAKHVKSAGVKIENAPELDAEVDAFLNKAPLWPEPSSLQTDEGDGPFDASEVTRSLDLSGGNAIDEKGIVS